MNENIQEAHNDPTGGSKGLADLAKYAIHETTGFYQKAEENLLDKLVGQLNTRIDNLDERITSLEDRVTELEKRKRSDKIREIIFILITIANIIVPIVLRFLK